MDSNGLVIGLVVLIFIVLIVTASLAVSRTNSCIN